MYKANMIQLHREVAKFIIIVMPRITLKTTAHINEEIEYMNSTISMLDLMDQYRTLRATIKELMFFSSIQKTSMKIEHVRGHKSSLQNVRLVLHRHLQSEKNEAGLT